MTDISLNDPVRLEQASERIRQERETFNQRKSQEARWFNLRLAMGYGAIVLLPAVVVICSYILANPSLFPSSVLTGAAGALLVDVVGLMLSVWKIVLNPSSVTKLEPVTAKLEVSE